MPASKLARKPQPPAPQGQPMPKGLTVPLQRAWDEYKAFNDALTEALAGRGRQTVRDLLCDQWRTLTGADYPDRALAVVDIALALQYVIIRRGYAAAGMEPTSLFLSNAAAAMAVVDGTPVALAGFGPRSLESRRYETESVSGRTIINLNREEPVMAKKSLPVAEDKITSDVSKASQVLNEAAKMICEQQHTDEEIVDAINKVHGTGAVTQKMVARVRRRVNHGKRAGFGFAKPKTPYARLMRIDGALVTKADVPPKGRTPKADSAKSAEVLKRVAGMTVKGKIRNPMPGTGAARRSAVQQPISASKAPKAAPKLAPKAVAKKAVKGK